jgi:putative phosphoesterase
MIPEFVSELRNLNHTGFNSLVARLPLKFADEFQGRDTSHNAASTMKIGIISDTHGLVRPEAIERLADVDHIIHAGDIGRPEVVSELRKIAPVTAIRGNVDRGEWAAEYPPTALVKLGGRSIHVLHNLNELDLDPAAAGIDVVVSGHSHRPRIETVGGVLYLNPGSAGPRRFSLPIALATLELGDDALRPHIHEIGGRPARSAAVPLTGTRGSTEKPV